MPHSQVGLESGQASEGGEAQEVTASSQVTRQATPGYVSAASPTLQEYTCARVMGHQGALVNHTNQHS